MAMTRINSIHRLIGKNSRRRLLFLSFAFSCAYSVQAAEDYVTYCMNAGAENDYDCAKVGTNNNSSNQANINAKLSELQRWLEDEEQVSNGNSLTRRAARHITDNKLQQKIEFNSKLLADELQQARTLQDKGDRLRAFEQINSYLAGNPKDLNGWLLYGIALMDRNKLQSAEDVFRKLIQLYPDAPEPYNNLAAIYARRGDNNKAIDILLQAFNTHPSYAQVRLNLKTVYASLANQVYNRALNVDEKDTLVTSNLSILDQQYIPIPVATPACIQSEAAISADQPVVTVTTAQQPIAPSPVAKTKITAEVDQAIKEAVATHTETKSASPDTTASSARLSPFDQITAKQLTELIFRWADAWSGRDVNQYISFYIDQYRPGKAVTHEQWVWNLKKRLSALEFIQVGISDISMVAMPDGRIRTVFKQDYNSNTFQDSVYTNMVFTPFAGSWKISAENTL